MARFSQLAVAAAGLAAENAGLNFSKEDPERLGVVMGNGNGGFPTTEENARVLVEKGGMRMSPFFIPMILPNMAAANISRLFRLKGYTSTIITAWRRRESGHRRGVRGPSPRRGRRAPGGRVRRRA